MGKKNKDFYVSVMSECIKSTYEWWGTDIMSMYSMIEKRFPNATKAGVENNYERAKELNGCFAWNCGDNVVKSKEERELAEYMFCIEDKGTNNFQDALQERILAAHAAGIGINDL